MQRVFSQTFGVVGAFLVKDRKILLVKEAGTSDKGKWNQPAGWPEVGEDLVLAAKRETEEETGYTFTPTHLLGIYSLVRKDSAKKLGGTPHAIKLIFVGEISGQRQEVDPGEIAEIKWFTPEEIEQMDATQLRDLDIKQMTKDYFSGQRYDLGALTHTVVE